MTHQQQGPGMAFPFVRPRGVLCPAFLSTLVMLVSAACSAAVMAPLEGRGQFPSSVEIVNRWRGEDRLDVMVLVEVSNADLRFVDGDRGLVAKLNLDVTLEGPDGQKLDKSRRVRTAPLTDVEATSRTLFQRFGLLLEDVPFRSGRITCRVRDVSRIRTGLANQMKRRLATSECTSLWFAEDSPRPDKGLALEDPLFLAQAPLESWNPGRDGGEDPSGGWLQDYMNPSRRYGLTEDHLQLFMPVWPPAAGIPPGRQVPGLRVQVTNLAMDFVVNDTIDIDERGRLALAAGRPAAVLYSLDVNILPEGPYRLSIAPLAGFGRGVLEEFAVVWQLDHLGRARSQVVGEGRLVFHGAQLERFLAASSTEQEKMLDEFWENLDTDPQDGVNAPRLEFEYRMAYVKQFLGGFGEQGPYDARGEVFLLLGPPDEIQSDHLPMNQRDQDDARIKVFKRFAPDREGTWAKGGFAEGTSQPRDPYATVGGLPMPSSLFAEKSVNIRRYTASYNYGFELWKYDNGGKPLFVNRFSRKGMGQRFLFVDRTGSGDFFLESSNLVQGEE